jgi:hypothetical protein
MIQTQATITTAPGGTFLHPMADPLGKVNVATVPCKYKVGRVLGQGTYAVVKGYSLYTELISRSSTYWNREILCCKSY